MEIQQLTYSDSDIILIEIPGINSQRVLEEWLDGFKYLFPMNKILVVESNEHKITFFKSFEHLIDQLDDLDRIVE